MASGQPEGRDDDDEDDEKNDDDDNTKVLPGVPQAQGQAGPRHPSWQVEEDRCSPAHYQHHNFFLFSILSIFSLFSSRNFFYLICWTSFCNRFLKKSLSLRNEWSIFKAD